MLDKKSKILFLVLSILLVVSIGVTFYKAFISEDFVIIIEEE